MVSDALKRLTRRPAGVASDPRLTQLKKRLIDRTFSRASVRSFADLGGVWAVDAGYTFYALEEHPIERAVLVDDDLTPAVLERGRLHPQLEFLEQNFGGPEVPGTVGQVDAVLLFDVLLHQVAPDWNEILAMYAPKTRAFLIVNPQLVTGEATVRLLDLGRERYVSMVPPQRSHDEIFDHADEINPRRGRANRDVHDIWQWGIVDADLDARMAALGFTLDYFDNDGPFLGLADFENRAYAYVRA